jgi:predicted DNA-binding transcriptional regulator AlpA
MPDYRKLDDDYAEQKQPAVKPNVRRANRPRGPPDDRLLTSRDIVERYSITKMTLWRWMHDAKMKFPLPIDVTKRRRYWKESEVTAWERAKIKRA